MADAQEAGTSARYIGETVRGLSREHTWDESTTEERIERLRTIVKQQGQVISDLLERVKLMEGHSHNQAGKILVGFKEARAEKSVVTNRRSGEYI